MNPQNSISIKSFSDLSDHVLESEMVIMEELHDLITSIHSAITYQFSYNVPFYSINRKRFMFVWPGSIPWGGIEKKTVRIGFTQGFDLITLGFPSLDLQNRKSVASVDIGVNQAINHALFSPIIATAVELVIKKDNPLS